jgi:hypothetical protein
VIEETLKNQLKEKQCLEAKIVSLRKEEEKKEDTSKSHLKEKFEDFNKHGAEFSQQERRLEE